MHGVRHASIQAPLATVYADMNNSRVIAVTLLTLLLGACNEQAPSDGKAGQSKDQVTPSISAAKPSNRLSSEQLKAVAATGKTGLWSDVTQICSGKARTHATLFWNVKASGVDKVNVYLVGRDSKERRFASGSAVGGRVTGPWLHPGTTFVLRATNDGQELGRIVFGKKQC
jgi:hypothetical protein